MNEPRKYRLRPLPVEAFQWDGTDANMYRIMAWIKDNGGLAYISSGYSSQGPDLIMLTTPKGPTRVVDNDVVVMDSEKVFRVHKPDRFQELYDSVSEPTDVVG
jgi:hypothetical protein